MINLKIIIILLIVILITVGFFYLSIFLLVSHDFIKMFFIFLQKNIGLPDNLVHNEISSILELATHLLKLKRLNKDSILDLQDVLQYSEQNLFIQEKIKLELANSVSSILETIHNKSINSVDSILYIMLDYIFFFKTPVILLSSLFLTYWGWTVLYIQLRQIPGPKLREFAQQLGLIKMDEIPAEILSGHQSTISLVAQNQQKMKFDLSLLNQEFAQIEALVSTSNKISLNCEAQLRILRVSLDEPVIANFLEATLKNESYKSEIYFQQLRDLSYEINKLQSSILSAETSIANHTNAMSILYDNQLLVEAHFNALLESKLNILLDSMYSIGIDHALIYSLQATIKELKKTSITSEQSKKLVADFIDQTQQQALQINLNIQDIKSQLVTKKIELVLLQETESTIITSINNLYDTLYSLSSILVLKITVLENVLLVLNAARFS